MTPPCETCDRDALSWAYQELDPVETAAFEAHLSAHPGHRRDAEEMAEIVRRTRRRDDLEPSPETLASLKLDARCAIAEQRANRREDRRRVDRAVATVQSRGRRAHWFFRRFHLPVWAAAAAALLLVWAGWRFAPEPETREFAARRTPEGGSAPGAKEEARQAAPAPLEAQEPDAYPASATAAALKKTVEKPVAEEEHKDGAAGIETASERNVAALGGATAEGTESKRTGQDHRESAVMQAPQVAVEIEGKGVAHDDGASAAEANAAVIARLEADDLEGALALLGGPRLRPPLAHRDSISPAEPPPPRASAFATATREPRAESLAALARAAMAIDDPRLRDAALALLLRRGLAEETPARSAANLAAVELALALGRRGDANAALARLPEASPEQARARRVIGASTPPP